MSDFMKRHSSTFFKLPCNFTLYVKLMTVFAKMRPNRMVSVVTSTGCRRVFFESLKNQTACYGLGQLQNRGQILRYMAERMYAASSIRVKKLIPWVFLL